MNTFLKKIGLETFIPFFLILLLFSYFVSYNQIRRKILVIHSYYTDYSWVVDLNKGLSSVLSDYDSLKVEYYYMDTKRHTEDQYKEKVGFEARRLIDMLQPDVVITFDDDAQTHVTSYYRNHPSISFVFAGVNADIEDYDFDKANNITGIMERLPLEGVHDTLVEMAKRNNIKNPLRVQHISSSARTVKLDDDYLHAYQGWGEVVIKPSRLVNTFLEWKKAILDATNESDFILISNYRKIAFSETNHALVPPEEIMKWTVENTRVPILGLNTFVVEDGGPLAIATSGYEQGEIAGKMALKILYEKIPASQISIEKPKQFVVSMRPKLMEKFSIKLPEIYYAFARIAHKYFE